MKERAMDRLRDQMAAADGEDGARRLVGEILTAWLLRHEDDAAALADETKTLDGAMTAMRAEAKGKKHGSVACLTMWEGMRAVFDYYGISATERALYRVTLTMVDEAPEEAPEETHEKAPVADALDLDALLGGI